MNLRADVNRWLRRALTPMLMVTSAAVPAGIPDDSEASRAMTRVHELSRRTAAVVEQARVDHLAQRYRRSPESIRDIVRVTERVGARYALPPALLLAIVETESSFDNKARSGYGARGLMQVVPRHHPAEIASIGGESKLHDTELGIEVGARILSGYLARSGSMERALKRYSGNAGQYAVKVLSRQQALEAVASHATRQLDTPLAGLERRPARRS